MLEYKCIWEALHPKTRIKHHIKCYPTLNQHLQTSPSAPCTITRHHLRALRHILMIRWHHLCLSFVFNCNTIGEAKNINQQVSCVGVLVADFNACHLSCAFTCGVQVQYFIRLPTMHQSTSFDCLRWKKTSFSSTLPKNNHHGHTWSWIQQYGSSYWQPCRQD